MKLFKVNFKVRCYCGGVYSYADAHLTVPAESEEEARKKVKENTQLEIIEMKARDVTPWKEK